MPPAGSIKSFAKAVFLGALVACAPYQLIAAFFVIIGLPQVFIDVSQVPAMLMLALAPLAVATPIVLSASIIVGIPLTLALDYWGCESAAAYIVVGGFAGAVLTAAGIYLIDVPDGYWLVIFGTLSGAVTGGTWWVLERKPRRFV